MRSVGSITTITLALMLLLSVMIGATMRLIAVQTRQVTDQEQAEQAFGLADAGAQYVMWLLSDSGGADPEDLGANPPDSFSGYELEVDGERAGIFDIVPLSASADDLIVRIWGRDGVREDICQVVDAGFSRNENFDFVIASWERRFDIGCEVIRPEPTLVFTANPTSVNQWQGGALEWTSTHADECVASGDWSGSKPTSGTDAFFVRDEPISLTLTCTGSGGSVEKTVDIMIHEPGITLTATPDSIDKGQSTTLNWTGDQNTDSCEASGDWSGSRTISGSEQVGPLMSSKTYILTCVGPGGESEVTETVTVNIPDLISYWKFDETSGSTAFDSVGSNHGTHVGSPVITTDIAPQPTGNLRSVEYDQVGQIVDYIELGQDPLIGRTQFSLSFWVKLNSQPFLDYGILRSDSLSGSPATDFYIRDNNNGTLTYFWALNTTGGTGFQQLNVARDNNWHHVVLTYDSSKSARNVYVDGVEQGGYVTTGPVTGNSSGLLVGTRFKTSPFAYDLNHKIDDLRLYDDDLSQADVTTLFNGNEL